MIDTNLILVILLDVLPVLYGIALFNYILVFATEETLVRRLARPLLVTAVLVNLVYFLAFTLLFEHVPLVTVYQVMGAVGFAVAGIYLLVESRTGSLYTGPFVLTLVLIFQILNTLIPKLDSYVPEILHSTLFSIHVSAAVLGYSGFALAAVYGILYLLQYQAIRDKRFGLIFRRLPPLDTLDRMNVYASGIGFVFLTLAILLGLLWSWQLYGFVQIDPKVWIAILTWAVYGLALVGRWFVSWQGPRMALSSVLGFVVVLFSMFAVNFFMTKFHIFVS